MTYLDTSALIKRFIEEEGSGVVRTLMRQPGSVATAKVAYVEVYAGLGRRRRAGDLSPKDHRVACTQFERDWPGYIRVDLADEILSLARDIIQRHPLRGFDAVHLASALSIRQGLEEDLQFVAADERLLRAATAEGLQALNVEPV